MSNDTETYAVGDVLAFRHYTSFGGVPPYSLHAIERITPTGLMACGGYKGDTGSANQGRVFIDRLRRPSHARDHRGAYAVANRESAVEDEVGQVDDGNS
jgi:hypothetical protein